MKRKHATHTADLLSEERSSLLEHTALQIKVKHSRADTQIKMTKLDGRPAPRFKNEQEGLVMVTKN